jgi:hypothetical protein
VEYNIQIFTLSNLTDVRLKIYYSPPPEVVGQVQAIAGGSDDDNRPLPGRVDISHLQGMLHRCPNLQVRILLDFSTFAENTGS